GVKNQGTYADELGTFREKKAVNLRNSAPKRVEGIPLLKLRTSPVGIQPDNLRSNSAGDLREYTGGVILVLFSPGMDIQEKDKKKAKNKQNQARNRKDKVKSKPKSVKVKKSTGKSTPKKSKVK
ncbi:hypothetical protein Tco_0873590, partial [Tanacetum coccineum]